MKGVKTRGATHNYGAPANWNEERDGVCHALSVRVGRFGEGALLESVSTWQPSPEELAHLCRGGVVVLSILAPQPAVSLTVEDPA